MFNLLFQVLGYQCAIMGEPTASLWLASPFSLSQQESRTAICAECAERLAIALAASRRLTLNSRRLSSCRCRMAEHCRRSGMNASPDILPTKGTFIKAPVNSLYITYSIIQSDLPKCQISSIVNLSPRL